MSKESYKVMNATRGPVSFEVYPIQDPKVLFAMPGHKRRKAIRSATVKVTVPHAESKDLVEETGLSVEDLKKNVNLHRLIGSGKLQVLEAKIVEEIKDEEKPKEPEPEKVEEDEEKPIKARKAKKKPTSKKKK